MSISTPAERIEPVLTWIQEQRDAALADLQRFCRQPASAASRVSPRRARECGKWRNSWRKACAN